MAHINETEFSYPVPVDFDMYDGSGAFFPSAYQKMTSRVVEAHLPRVELDMPRLMEKYNVTWVLLALSVELRRPLTANDHLTAQTWHAGSRGTTYRRDIVLRDEAGEIVAVAATFSAVLDLATRRVCMDRSILAQIDLPAGETLLEASAKFRDKSVYTEVERRIARPSWQDGNGHVHNVRYGEFVYDALTETERLALKGLKRLDVWFLSELLPGQEFSVQKCEAEDGSVIVKGVLPQEEKASFAMKLRW